MNEKFFKGLGVFAAVLWGVPLLLTADATGFEEHDFLRLAGCVGAAVAIYVCGYFLAGLSGKLKNPVTANLIYYAVGVCVIVGCILFSAFCASGTLYPMLIIPWGVYYYCSGGRLARKKMPINSVWLSVYALYSIFAYWLYGCFAAEHQRGAGENAIVIITVLMLICGANLLNQKGITDLASRRSNAALPKNFRRFNSGLVTVFLAVILLLYLFKDVFADGLSWLIKSGIVGFINFMQGLSAPNVDNTAFGNSKLDHNLESVGEGDGTAFAVVAAILLIGLICWIFRKYILDAIRSAGRFFRKKFNSTPDEEDGEGYTDYLSWENTDRKKEKSPYKAALRDYRRERDQNARYRLGYRVFLAWLEMKGVELKPDDTVERQLEKSQVAAGEIAEKYRRLRYNDENVTAEQSRAMDDFLKLLAKSK